MPNIGNDFKDYIYDNLRTKTELAYAELDHERSKFRKVIKNLTERVEKSLPKIKGFSFYTSVQDNFLGSRPNINEKMNDLYIEFKLDKNNQTKKHLDEMINIASAEIEIEISLIINDMHNEIKLLRRRVNRFVRSR
jgi:predicted transport protein